MLNSEASRALDAVDGSGGRRFNKREGWYSFLIEEVTEEDNVNEPDHAFVEYNVRSRVLNGPSKGVEFMRISVPPTDHPDFRAKQYNEQGEALKDADGEPVYVEPAEYNGRGKKAKGIFEDVMTSVLVGDAVKGRGEEAKAKRKKMIKDAVEAANGSIGEALNGGKFIAKMRLDHGQRPDRDTGEMVVYSKSLKESPKLKPVSFMSYDEAREKKYVLDPKNMTPGPAGAKPVAKVDLSL